MAIEILHEYRIDDKTSWPPGPWRDEPDKIQWRDAATGLPCLIVRGPMGALCGYVGVDERHPWYGRDFDEVPGPDVHGGLTFSKACAEGPEQEAICHIPEPGQPDRVWWFGFDCAHMGDLCPKYLAVLSYSNWGGVYRDMSYVQAECAALAEQLVRVAHSEVKEGVSEKSD